MGVASLLTPASWGTTVACPIACTVDCALSLDLFLLKRFSSLSLFLLLDEPQPRKTSGEDHHHDENGVFYHRRSCPELMFTDQDCFRISLGLDLHQELLAFHDLDRQLEINQPRLQKGQRQHVLRVDIKGVVAGMGPLVELEERSSPRVALRAEIDALEQVISPSERTAGVSNQPCQ